MKVTIEIEKQELDFIKESLEYSRRKFEDYDHYPSKEFKKERVSFVAQLIEKLKSYK